LAIIDRGHASRSAALCTESQPLKYGVRIIRRKRSSLMLMAFISAINPWATVSEAHHQRPGASAKRRIAKFRGATYDRRMIGQLLRLFGACPNNRSARTSAVAMTGRNERHVVTIGALFLDLCDNGLSPKVGGVIVTSHRRCWPRSSDYVSAWSCGDLRHIVRISGILETPSNMVIFAHLESASGMRLSWKPGAEHTLPDTAKILLTADCASAAL